MQAGGFTYFFIVFNFYFARLLKLLAIAAFNFKVMINDKVIEQIPEIIYIQVYNNIL